MKKNMRKIIAVILIITMLPWQDAITAYAAETELISSQETADVDKQTEESTPESVFDGDYYLNGENLTLDGKSLTINGNLIQQSGSINVGNGRLIINGDYVIQGSGREDCITMDNDGKIIIDGNIECGWNDVINGGTLELKGDITGRILSYNNGLLVFTGERQCIDTERSSFDRIEIKNINAEIIAEKDITFNEITINERAIYNGIPVIYGYNLNEDMAIEGDIGIIGGTLDLNGHTLKVSGSFYHYDGTVNINGGTFISGGDYIYEKNIFNSTGITEQRKLIMDSAGSKIIICGSLHHKQENDDETEISAGEITAYGDFDSNIIFKEDATVILKGSAGQKFSCNEIYKLVIDNESGERIALYGKIFGLENKKKSKTGGNISADVCCLPELNEYAGSIALYNRNNMPIDDKFRIEGNMVIYEPVEIEENAAVEITDKLFINAALTVRGSAIAEEIQASGGLNIENGNVIANKSLRCYGDNYISGKNSYLYATEEFDLSFAGISEGTIELSGDGYLNSYTGGENSSIVLSGSGKQTIRVYSHVVIDTLDNRNQSDEGVEFSTLIKVKRSTGNGKTSFGGYKGVIGWTLSEDEVIEGDLTISTGILDLNGHRLTVNGNFRQEIGEIHINGGELIVEGDFIIPNRHGEETAILYMNDDNDRVVIYGNYLYEAACDSADTLTSGTFKIYGNIHAGYFPAKGTHTVILCGTQKQDIVHINSGKFSINNLRIENNREIYIGNISIDGEISGNTGIIRGQYTICAENIKSSLNMSGQVTILTKSSGTVYVEDEVYVFGSVEALGDICFEKLYVNGTLTVCSMNPKKGIIEVTGDIICDSFIAEEDSIVRLSGNNRQRVSAKNSRFATIELRNTGGGVYFENDVEIDNIISNGCYTNINGIEGQWGFTLERDMIMDGDLNLIGACLDLNGYKLTINGNLVHNAGDIKINGGSLIINGSLYEKYQSGKFYMNGADDVVWIKENLVIEGCGLYLSDGNMSIGGDISIDNNYPFTTTGNHCIILDGSGKQQLNVGSKTDIANLKVVNTSADGVILNGDVYISKGISDIYKKTGGSGYIRVNDISKVQDGTMGGNLYANSDCTLSGDYDIGGSLIINGEIHLGNHVLASEKMTINGKLYADRGSAVSGEIIIGKGGMLIMTDPGCVVKTGDFTISTDKSHEGYLTGGTLYVSGDFIQKDGCNFIATDRHNTVLSGSNTDIKQHIVFENEGECHFNILTLTRDKSEGYVYDGSWEKIYNELNIRLNDGKNIGSVTGIRATGKTSVSITIEYEYDGDESEIYGYEIYRNNELCGITVDKKYTDTGLIPGRYYNYKVKAFDRDNRKSADNEGVWLPTENDNRAPEIITDLYIASRMGKGVVLEWSRPYDESGIKCYTIWQNGEILASNITETRYFVKNLTANTEYEYFVTAADIADNISEKSEPVYTSTMEPQIISVTSDKGSICGQTAGLCVKYTDMGEYAVESLELFYAGKDGRRRYVGNIKTSQTGTDNGVREGHVNWDTAYMDDGDYTVYAVLTDSTGCTDEKSILLTIDNTAPQAVTNVTAESENGEVRLSFDMSESGDCTGYNIYRCIAGGQPELYESIKGRYETEYTDKNVNTGLGYTYLVTATDKAGNESSTSEPISICAERDVEKPVICDIEVPDVSGSRAVIKVTAADNKQVTGIALYYIDNNTEKLIESKSNISNEVWFAWNTAGVSEGDYEVFARARDKDGNISEDTVRAVCHIDHSGPEKVYITKTDSTEGSVYLQWSIVTDKDFLHYRIYMYDGNGYREIARTDRMITYTATGLVPDTEYGFIVTAYDTLLNCGVDSDEVRIKTLSDNEGPEIILADAEKLENSELKLIVSAADVSGIAKAEFTVLGDTDSEAVRYSTDGKGSTEETLEKVINVSSYEGRKIYLKYDIYDTAGNQSSTDYMEYTVDNIPPSQVNNLRIINSTGSICLQWDEDEAGDAIYYSIYRADRNTGIYRQIASEISTCTYNDNTAITGQQYMYAVTAWDKNDNESPKSNEVYAVSAQDMIKPVVRGIGPGDETVGINEEISVYATDNHMLDKVVIYVKRQGEKNSYELLYKWTDIKSDELYGKFIWNTAELINGERYEIKAEAVDISGNRSELLKREVMIDNLAPQKPVADIIPGNFCASITIKSGREDDFSYYEILRRENGRKEFEAVARITGDTYKDTQLSGNITYHYIINAYDINGNMTPGDEYEVIPEDDDDVCPEIVTSGLLMGLTGKAICFDASESYDNVGIAGFEWSIGDEKISGARAEYTYNEAGSYTAGLKVYDTAGNVSEKTIIVTIRNSGDNGSASVIVKNSEGEYIKDALVYVLSGEEEYASLGTDTTGMAYIAGPEGEYTVLVYSEGYSPVSSAVNISKLKDNRLTVILEKKSFVQGDVKVHKLTLEELVALGVDLSDPENYHTYRFRVTLKFVEKRIPEVTYVTANGGGIIEADGSTNPSGSGAYYWYGPDGICALGVLGTDKTEEAKPVFAYVSLTKSITWLKDMYQAELEIINSAPKEFVLSNSIADINIPEGVALAATNRKQLKTYAMDDIPGQSTGMASWILKGNESGDYDISVDYSSILMPVNKPLNMSFKGNASFSVTTGEGIEIHVYPESTAYIGKSYYVHFEIINKTGKELYNFKTNIGTYRQEEGYYEIVVKSLDEEGNETKHIISSLDNREADETDDDSQTDGNMPKIHYSIGSNRCRTVNVTYGNSTTEVGVFYPGERLYGSYATVFSADTESDPDEVYYQLIDSLAETIGRDNLGVKVFITPIQGHITRYLEDLRPRTGSLYGDPVDVTTGAFTDSRVLAQVSGGRAIEFSLLYNSMLSQGRGELGYGWSHDYESYITDYNGQLMLTLSPSRKITFLNDEMMSGVIYGRVINTTILIDEEHEFTGSFTCINNGMEGYRIEKSTDREYILYTPSGDRYHYGSDGRLKAVTNDDGRNVTLTRSGSLLYITDVLSGAYVKLKYNEEGLVESAEDSIGNTAYITYTDGLLTGYTDACGNNVQYVYDENKRIIEKKVNGVTSAANEYDENNRVTVQKTRTLKSVFEYTDDAKSHTVRITDSEGNTYVNVCDNHYNIISATDGEGNTTEYTYDPDGNLITIQNPDKTVERYVYDEDGNQIQITDVCGNVTSMEYDGNGNAVRIYNTERSHEFLYDNKNHLIKSTEDGKPEKTYTYDAGGYLALDKEAGLRDAVYYTENGRTAWIKDRRGNVSYMYYDSAGRMIKTVDKSGAETLYEYDGNGNNISITNALGGKSRYEYDFNGNVTRATDAMGNSTVSTYDDNGNITSVTSKNGRRTEYVYDGTGNLIRIRYPDNTEESYTYDSNGNITSYTDRVKAVTTYEYDCMKRLIKKTDNEGGITAYTYNRAGLLTGTYYPDNTKEILEYDSRNRLICRKNPDGTILNYTYDKNGNITAITDAMNVTVRYKYDIYDRPVMKTDGCGNRTEYEYDDEGNCTGVRNPDGTYVSFEYDSQSRLTAVCTDTETYGRVCVTYEYDALSRIIKTTDEAGNITCCEYDMCDNLRAVTDGRGNRTEYTYDPEGNVLSVTDAEGNRAENIYDTQTGYLIKTIQELNEENSSETTYEYTPDGRLKKVTDSLKGVSSCAYDSLSRISKVTDPNGGSTEYTYDACGRITGICSAIGSRYRTEYNEYGMKESEINARGQNRVYSYDRAGRISSFTDEAGEVSYTYDNNGNITAITETDAEGRTERRTYSYDCMNRVTQSTDYRGKTVKYSYDELGNLISLTYPGGEIVRYEYYPDGRIKQVTDPYSNVTSYTYDGNGNIIKTVNGDGTEEENTYDKNNRLTQQKTSDGKGSLISFYEYSYDRAGNITVISGVENTPSGITDEEYVYDAANRLISYNGEKVTYDSDGNMTYGPLDGEMAEYEYDCRNRLIRAGNTSYEYDAADIRISAGTDGYTEYYVTDTVSQYSRVLSRERHYSEGKRENCLYVYGNGLISQTESGKTEYLHYNNVGSTTYITVNGRKTESFAYSPYGKLLAGDGTATAFLYNGRLGVMTDDNGLYYMRARYYNPCIRRFINQDILTGSIAESQSLNRYAYCQGNPVNAADPLGLSPERSFAALGHTILNIISFVPVIGEVADAVNAVWYLAEGRYLEAGVCLIGALPLGSLVADSLKMTRSARAMRIVSASGKAAIGFSNASRNASNIYNMILSGTGHWYDYLREGGMFTLNVVTAALGVNQAGMEISGLADDIRAERVRRDSDGESGRATDFYVTPNGDIVPATGYRYVSENASYLDDMTNNMTIPANADGTYFSFNNYDVANPSALQVPHDASVKVSFDTLQIIDDISVPYGNWGKASYLEPITTDFPQFGSGGATQVITHSPIKIKSITKLPKH